MIYNSSFENFIKNSEHFDKMQKFINSCKGLCPNKKNVFRFLNCDLSKTKCIILGMDPYSSTYNDNGIELPVATGRAFELANITYWTEPHKQLSLTQIFKTLAYLKFGKIYDINTLRSIINKECFKYLNIHDWFDEMEKEGVIFLNATLTTIVNKSGAHERIWKDFMDELLHYIVDKNKKIIWLIWGESARKRVDGIVDTNNIVYTCHPAARQNNTFIKDCTFRKVENINWV